MPCVFHHSKTVPECAGDRFAAAAATAAAATSTTPFCCLDKAEACGIAVRFLEVLLSGTLQHEALNPRSSGLGRVFF